MSLGKVERFFPRTNLLGLKRKKLKNLDTDSAEGYSNTDPEPKHTASSKMKSDLCQSLMHQNNRIWRQKTATLGERWRRNPA